MSELSPVHKAITDLRQKLTLRGSEETQKANTIQRIATEFVSNVERMMDAGPRSADIRVEQRNGNSYPIGKQANVRLRSIAINTNPKTGPTLSAMVEPVSADPLAYQLVVSTPYGTSTCAAFEHSHAGWLIVMNGQPSSLSAESIAAAFALGAP